MNSSYSSSYPTIRVFPKSVYQCGDSCFIYKYLFLKQTNKTHIAPANLSSQCFLQCVSVQLISYGLTWNTKMILVSKLIYFFTGHSTAILAPRSSPDCVICYSITAFILHCCSQWKSCQRLQWYKGSPSLNRRMVLYSVSVVYCTQNSLLV